MSVLAGVGGYFQCACVHAFCLLSLHSPDMSDHYSGSGNPTTKAEKEISVNDIHLWRRGREPAYEEIDILGLSLLPYGSFTCQAALENPRTQAGEILFPGFCCLSSSGVLRWSGNWEKESNQWFSLSWIQASLFLKVDAICGVWRWGPLGPQNSQDGFSGTVSLQHETKVSWPFLPGSY